MNAAHANPKRPRVVIVEDHALFADCLAVVLKTRLGMEVCGQASDARSGLRLATEQRPDLVIVDLTLAEGHGLELIKDLAVLESPPPTLVVSGHEEDLYAERCLTAGAHGYVRKTCGMAGLLEAARRVMAGMVHVSPELMQRMLNQRRAKSSPGSPLGLLSDREMQVLEGIGRGRSTKEIAASLGVDAATIDSHRGRLREKLGLSGMHALAVYAFQWVHLGVMSATPGKTTSPTGAESARPGIGVVQGKNAGSVR